MSTLLCQTKKEQFAEILKWGLKIRFGYDVFLITWTNPDRSISWQVRTNNHVYKKHFRFVNVYIRGAADAFGIKEGIGEVLETVVGKNIEKPVTSSDFTLDVGPW